MSKQPIQVLLDRVEWTPLPPFDGDGTIPHATHEGDLIILGISLKCYQLSDGQRVFDADSIVKFLTGKDGE